MSGSHGFILPPEQVTRHHLHDPVFRRFLVVSLVIHAVLIGAAGTVTLFRMSGTSYAPSYTVDLVSLPSAAPAPSKAPSKAAAKPAVRKPARPAVKKVKKEPETSTAVIRPAVPTAGDEPAKAERRRRLEEMEQEASSLYESYSDEGPLPDGAAGPEVPGAVTGAGGDVGRPGPASNIRFRAYYDRIWSRIRASWVLPEGVVGSDEELLAVVGIRISATGEIEDMWIERSSGNIYYDQSAIRALGRASPLPPLPEDMGDGSLEVGINFRSHE